MRATRALRTAKRLQQSAQRLHIFHIFGEIFALRGFQDLWNFAQTAIPHDEAEGIEFDFAFADVFMSIHSRAARSFGIVDMNRNETIETDYAVELAKCFSNC